MAFSRTLAAAMEGADAEFITTLDTLLTEGKTPGRTQEFLKAVAPGGLAREEELRAAMLFQNLEPRIKSLPKILDVVRFLCLISPASDSSLNLADDAEVAALNKLVGKA